MSNSPPIHPNIWKKEREREREREREKRRGQTCCPRQEREIGRAGHGVNVYGVCRLINRPDLAPVKDRGQWAEVRGRVEK